MKGVLEMMRIYMKVIRTRRKRNVKQEKGKMSQKRGKRIKRDELQTG